MLLLHLTPVMMRLVRLLCLLIMVAGPCRGAVNILITPGSSAGTMVFVINQISPSPTLNVSGISGYVSAMSLPATMVNIPGFEGGSFSDIFGNLLSPLATVTEGFSEQSYLLNKIRISSEPTAPSMIGFDRVFTTASGAHSLRFDVVGEGPVEVNISAVALSVGVHTIDDLLFGMITVVVVPEPTPSGLLALALVPLIMRRRRRAVCEP